MCCVLVVTFLVVLCWCVCVVVAAIVLDLMYNVPLLFLRVSSMLYVCSFCC